MHYFHKPVLLILLLCVESHVNQAWAARFRIATYNIHYDNYDTDAMVQAVRAAEANVVCFQEANDRTMKVIRDRLSGRFPYISRENQFGFAAKTPPTQTELDPEKRFRIATFVVGGREIRVVNTHLTPIDLPKEPNLLQVMAALSKSETAHLNEIGRLNDRVDLNLPTIVLGDFNALSQSKAIGQLKALGLADSFATVQNDADRHATWDWQSMLRLESGKYQRGNLGVINSGDRIDIGLRIDYILHTEHFRTIESKVIRRPGSDHYLVVSELTWTP